MRLPTLLALAALLLGGSGFAQMVMPGATAPGASQTQPPSPPPRRIKAHPPQQSPVPSATEGHAHKTPPGNNQNLNAASPSSHTSPGQNRRGNNRQITEEMRKSYAAALQRCHRERHDRWWWKQHYTVIVLVLGGYYYWDSGYWYPAWGYDTTYENYDYNGPIYTYGNLLPDQVVINVQRALKDLGYYGGDVTGSLGPTTRQAISAFQQDNGLDVTGAVDEPTVYALGLIND